MVDAILAVSAHRTLREPPGLLPLPPLLLPEREMDDGAIDEADEEADTSRANLSPRDSYCDCRSRMKLGGPGGSPPMMRSEEDSPAVPPDAVEDVGCGCPPDDDELVVWDMLRDGRFRLAPMRALAARSAADVMILCMRRMLVCVCVCVLQA
jgi:hypothetical protein